MAYQNVSKDPPDIEVSHYTIEDAAIRNTQFGHPSSCCPSPSLPAQNLLALNPRVRPHASLVPSTATKKARKHWKRNKDKSCAVSANDLAPTIYIACGPSSALLEPTSLQ